jgi:saccharopepsin
VPSADCSGDCESWAGPRLRFYSNHSSTYSVLESQAVVLYGTDAFTGDLALDTFRIAGLEVDSQRFMNARQAEPLGFISFYHGYDGVLGLAPRFYELGKYDFRKAPSPWFNMVNDSLLDSNLFALELPTGIQHWQDINRWGEISFGGISEKYASSNFSRLPLNQFSDQVWAVEAPSLTWENATHPLHEDFVNVTLAGFDTTAWFIGLPGDWPKRIYASVDHSCGFMLCTIDCMARDKMPNLTFGLAGGNFTITPYGYTNEVEVPGKEKICLFNIYPTKGDYPTDAIVLGKPFMEAFYSVFDLDNMEIRLTERIK